MRDWTMFHYIEKYKWIAIFNKQKKQMNIHLENKRTTRVKPIDGIKLSQKNNNCDLNN